MTAAGLSDLGRVRELDLEAPSEPGRPAFVSAASGLVCVGNYLYVVADDELSLGVFDQQNQEPGKALADGSIVFSSIAENTTDAYRDGPCRGAALGVIGDDGELRSVHRLDAPYKIEGLHAEAEGGTVRLLLVTDADDPGVPAVLFGADFG